MGGLHDCDLVEDIKMVFFNEEEFDDKFSMVHRFVEKIANRNKTKEFEFTGLCRYFIEYVEAWNDSKTIWGDTFRFTWKPDHNNPSVWVSTILAVQMKLSTGCTSCSWFEDYGGAAFVGNPEQSKLSLGDVAKMSGCALDITCHFEHCYAPTSSQREIYMPDGSKVFSEETDYDWSDNDYKYKMHNADFGKTSFISVIEDNRFEEELMHLTLNGEVQNEAQQSQDDFRKRRASQVHENLSQALWSHPAFEEFCCIISDKLVVVEFMLEVAKDCAALSFMLMCIFNTPTSTSFFQVKTSSKE